MAVYNNKTENNKTKNISLYKVLKLSDSLQRDSFYAV